MGSEKAWRRGYATIPVNMQCGSQVKQPWLKPKLFVNTFFIIIMGLEFYGREMHAK